MSYLTPSIISTFRTDVANVPLSKNTKIYRSGSRPTGGEALRPKAARNTAYGIHIFLIFVVFWILLGFSSAFGQVIVVPWDADVRVMSPGNNVSLNNRSLGVGHSYYWGDPRLGRGMPGWPANAGPGFQQGASTSFNGVGIGGTTMNGYQLAVIDQTQTPFTTSVVPVVGGYSRYDSPTNRRQQPALPGLSDHSSNYSRRQLLKATRGR